MGANRTGRPFTGDSAGGLLYATLGDFGFACGSYGADPGDGLVLRDCRITNAVRCVPPQNKPQAAEAAACRRYLAAEIAAMSGLGAILALGQIAHGAVLRALALRPGAWRFAHGAVHRLDERRSLFDSYHCSRLNTNTGRLTPTMFADVFAAIRAQLGDASR